MPKFYIRVGLSLLATSLLSACGGSSTAARDTASGTASVSTVSQGPINGFGSVEVNGVRYAISNAQLSDEEGVLKQARDLNLGMVVQVLGQTDSAFTTGAADSLEIRKSVQGSLETVGADCAGAASPLNMTSYCVLGQSVDSDSKTIVVGYSVGVLPASADFVEIYGARGADGRVHASLLVKKAPAATPRYTVGGPVTALDTVAHSFKIGDLVINYPAGVVLTNGKDAYASGTQITGSGLSTVLTATKVKQRNDHRDYVVGESGRARIKGAVQQVADSNQIIIIDSVSVQLLSTTRYNGLTGASDLTLNRVVEVKGKYVGSVLQANEIQSDDYRRSTAGGSGNTELHGVVLSASTSSTSASGPAGNSFRVHDVLVDTSTCSICAEVNYGDYVEVKGNLSGNTLVATKLESKKGKSQTADGYFEFNGVISNLDSTNTTFKAGNLSVNSANANFRDGNRSLLVNGAYVELKGAVDAQGIFQASEVVFRRNAGSTTN